jgi:hypothetical protein
LLGVEGVAGVIGEEGCKDAETILAIDLTATGVCEDIIGDAMKLLLFITGLDDARDPVLEFPAGEPLPAGGAAKPVLPINVVAATGLGAVWDDAVVWVVLL